MESRGIMSHMEEPFDTVTIEDIAGTLNGVGVVTPVEITTMTPIIETSATITAPYLPKVKLKRGSKVSFMDTKQHLQVTEGIVIAVQALPVPTDYTLLLVRSKGLFSVVVAHEDWLRMADGVRGVENDAVDKVEGYLKTANAGYLSISSASFGGKGGLSAEYIANRLWRPICGRKLKPLELYAA